MMSVRHLISLVEDAQMNVQDEQSLADDLRSFWSKDSKDPDFGRIGTASMEIWGRRWPLEGKNERLFLVGDGEPLAFMNLVKEGKNLYRVAMTYLDPMIRRQGHGVDLYRWLAKSGLTLQGDINQTTGARMLWASLARDPSLSVWQDDTGTYVRDANSVDIKEEYFRTVSASAWNDKPHNVEVFRNPSKIEFSKLLKSTGSLDARGLLDLETGDVLVWVVHEVPHDELMKQLDGDEYERIIMARDHVMCYADEEDDEIIEYILENKNLQRIYGKDFKLVDIDSQPRSLTESVDSQKITSAIKNVTKRYHGFGGNCADFAFVLNKVLGGDGTYMVADSGDHYEYADHVALLYDGHLYDASGEIDIEYLRDYAKDEDDQEGEVYEFHDETPDGRNVRRLANPGTLFPSLNLTSLERDLRSALSNKISEIAHELRKGNSLLREEEEKQNILVVVHPGSACGSADFNLGKMQARADREFLAQDIASWKGGVIIIDGDLSDELPGYVELNVAITRALANAKSSGMVSTRIMGDAGSSFNQEAAIRKVIKTFSLNKENTLFYLTGAWVQDDGQGCVDGVREELIGLGFDVDVRDSAISLDD